MIKIKYKKFTLGIFIIFVTVNLNAELTLQQELKNMSKNLYAQAGFYSTCGNKKNIEKNKYVLKWTQYKASQYLALIKSPKSKDKLIKENLKNLKKTFEKDKKILSTIEELNQFGMLWFKNGTKGIMISDPKISDETFLLNFNRKNCEIVKNLLETNFVFMYNTVFK